MDRYGKTALVIEDPSTDEWSVSFTSNNPDREDCVDCKTEEDAWRLKCIWDRTMANIRNDVVMDKDVFETMRREGREHATMLAVHLDAMMAAKATIPVTVKDANYIITVERVPVK